MALLVGCGDDLDDLKALNDLDDQKTLNKIVEEALDLRKSRQRHEGDFLKYAPNSQEPYAGWIKMMYDNGQVKMLSHHKDGKQDGLYTSWHENGQKKREGSFKNGQMNGVWTHWDENGNVLDRR